MILINRRSYMRQLVYRFLAFILFLSICFGVSPLLASAVNLVANPSVEIAATTTQPANWTSGNWGSNTASFSYMDGGHSGNKSLYVNVSNYVDGDAKWYSDSVAVTPGANYTYSDYYMSNVSTSFHAALTDNTGNTTYIPLGSVAASSSWQQTNFQFYVPTNVVKVSVLHVIAANGWLQTDDFSLAPTNVDPTGNLVMNPSFETVNASQPAGWINGKWGTNTTNFSYVSGDAHTGNYSAKIAISNYTDGDAKWYFTPLTNLVSGSQYNISAWYKTNTQPHVVIMYTDASGTEHYSTIANPLPNGSTTSWQQYKSTFFVPQGTKSVTAFMLISSNGWLQIDDYSITPHKTVGFKEPIISLTFDDGCACAYTGGLPILKQYGFVSTQYVISDLLNTPDYMTTAMVKAFQTQGSEIGSHSVTHADLTTLASSQINQELSLSQTTLRKLFGSSVALDFATPYGAYNQTALNAIKTYYRSHRSTDVGYNSKDTFNAYNIVTQDVKTTTTPAEVAAWVAQAKADKTWLVIVYHDVATSGSDYLVTPANLSAEFANIKNSGIPVKTISQALDEINTQL